MDYRKAKGRKDTRYVCPLICQRIPFVIFDKTAIYPFVGRKLPFIRIKGFTLIELIITMTIAGILIAIAAPSMQTFVSSNRLTSQVNDLLADINLARSEAIKRNDTAGVCVTAKDGTSCVTSGNWANGWLVYYNNSGTKVTVKIREALAGKNTLASPGDELVFSKSGLLASGASGAGQFTLTDPKTGAKRIVCVANTGRPSLNEGNCS